jgi:hypothetical protein
MRYAELNLLGVYVSPMSAMLLAAWVVVLVLRRVGDRLGLWPRVWHPALFGLSVYVIVAAMIVIAMGS